MFKYSRIISALLIAGGIVSLPSLAQAQSLSVRAEPGLAGPLNEPQIERFGVGGAIAGKPELTLWHYLGVGPSVSYVALPSRISGVDTGTALGFGGFARVKRPHDELNKGSGWSAASMWGDVDLQYVRTDPLDRFSWSAAVGAAVPTSDARSLWIGPFVRYQNVHEGLTKFNVNTEDANILIGGVSFELEPAHKKAAPPPPPPPPPVEPPPPVQPPVETPPPAVSEDVNVDLKVVIQFAWDSPVLDNVAMAQLNNVVAQLTASFKQDPYQRDYKSIRIEGHASSEGQVKHNDVLSQDRANSVLEFLAAHGIPRDKLSAVGFGSRVPVADNATEAGRVLNRRAEFEVHFIITKESK